MEQYRLAAEDLLSSNFEHYPLSICDLDAKGEEVYKCSGALVKFSDEDNTHITFKIVNGGYLRLPLSDYNKKWCAIFHYGVCSTLPTQYEVSDVSIARLKKNTIEIALQELYDSRDEDTCTVSVETILEIASRLGIKLKM